MNIQVFLGDYCEVIDRTLMVREYCEDVDFSQLLAKYTTISPCTVVCLVLMMMFGYNFIKYNKKRRRK